MNMQEAADRLGNIVKKLGGGTSTTDEQEIKALLADMQASAGNAHPKAKPRKKRATATARQEKPAAPAKATTKAAPKKKAKGK